jgi:hypothetical protein
MEAPGRTPPVKSVTVPCTVPVVSAAKSDVAKRRKAQIKIRICYSTNLAKSHVLNCTLAFDSSKGNVIVRILFVFCAAEKRNPPVI